MEELSILEQEIWGNPIREFLICIGVLLLGLLLKRLGATFLSKQSFRFFKRFAHNQFSEEFVALIRKPFEQLLTLIIIYVAFNRLVFPETWHMVGVEKIGIRWLLFTAWMIAVFVIATRILLRATDFFSLVLSRREDSSFSPELANFLKELIKVVLVIVMVFAGLRFVFEVNITALVASLGIGGLAVALAAQDTLANLLGSFIIYLDKPFKTGDLIETNDIKGSVEHVGFRTTRIRTVEKSLLTVPNKKLIDTALNNITESASRRVRFTLGLTYASKSEQILSIIDDIKKEIDKHPLTGDDYTVRFTEFSQSSLDILVVYFVLSNEYDIMIAVKEELNVKMMNIIEQHGCDFAYPTQTVYVKQ
ncbi:MAG: mechanosensitive ion channel family protein [Bacteroidota bacterium]